MNCCLRTLCPIKVRLLHKVRMVAPDGQDMVKSILKADATMATKWKRRRDRAIKKNFICSQGNKSFNAHRRVVIRALFSHLPQHLRIHPLAPKIMRHMSCRLPIELLPPSGSPPPPQKRYTGPFRTIPIRKPNLPARANEPWMAISMILIMEPPGAKVC